MQERSGGSALHELSLIRLGTDHRVNAAFG
jgi:hypothetical protein